MSLFAGHNIGSNAIKTYIDDNIDTMEANAKNIQKIQTEALAHLRKTVKDLDKSAGFTALENKAKTDAAKLVDIYKKGGLLQGNAATFQNNMRNVQPNNLARVFFEEGSNTMSNKSWDAKDLDAGVAPGTSKAARDAAKKRKADRAAQAAQNVSGASTNNVQGGPTTAKAQQCLKKK
ncbi:hypothetical protein BC832DRAFT_564140 [Gaertneriomyces semiglobifer]|nr:hypothetical protein BC832DRAFT_564140 [Gaertneriomyces semiglobifer]